MPWIQSNQLHSNGIHLHHHFPFGTVLDPNEVIWRLDTKSNTITLKRKRFSFFVPNIQRFTAVEIKKGNGNQFFFSFWLYRVHSVQKPNVFYWFFVLIVFLMTKYLNWTHLMLFLSLFHSFLLLTTVLSICQNISGIFEDFRGY